MRTLLVVAALLLAAVPAAARPRHAHSCGAHEARAAKVHRPRACARLRGGRIHTAARSLGRVTFPAAAAPPAPSPSAAPAPVATPAPTAEPPTLPPVVSNPRAVQVQGFEYGLQLSKPKVSAGSVKIEFNLTRAQDPHNLVLVRADGSGAPISFDEQPAGAVATRAVPLTTGTWTLFCSLTGHQALGMRATLKVG